MAVMGAGLVWYLLGLQVSPTNKLYHQISQVFFWLPGLLYLVFNAKKLRCWAETWPVLALLLAFAAWSLMTALWAEGEVTDYKEVFYILLTLNAFMILAYQENERFWKLLAYSSLVGGGLAWYGIAEFYFFDGHGITARVTGPGAVDHTILGSHLMGALFVVLFSLRDRLAAGLRSWVWLLALAGYFAYLVLSKSKGPLVALLIALCVLLILHYGRRAMFTIGALIVLGILYVVFFPEYALRGGLSYRTEAWTSSLELLAHNPLHGIGLNIDYPVPIESLSRPLTHAHNFYLNLAIRLGMVGLILWVMIELWVVRVALRSWRTDGGKMLIGLVIFSTLALMTDGTGPWFKPNETWFTAWLPIGLALALASTLRHGPNEAVDAEVNNLRPQAGQR